MLLATASYAQERPKVVDETTGVISMDVKIVFSEFEGEKRVTSLPYILSSIFDESDRTARSSLRMGIRVPILTDAKEEKIQYNNVGTDVDCVVRRRADNRFRVELTVNRSSVFTPGGTPASPGASISSRPILGNFSSTFNVMLRDGESREVVVASDPVTGRLSKIEVSLKLVK
jgi:hypothetical protein